MDRIDHHKIPVSKIQDIKHGHDYQDENGDMIPNSDLTTDPPLPRTYAFLSDTKYDELLVEDIRGVDLLYHEATFLHDMAERAEATYHSTAKQAALLASKADVKKLLIGHFSARYRDLDPLLDEARKEFKNTELAVEGKVFNLPPRKAEIPATS